MMSTLPDFLQLSYRADLDMLVGRWMRSVSSEELRQGYQAMLDEAARHHYRFWLVDTRRRISVNADDIRWLIAEFYPQLQPRLGRTTYLSFLLAPQQMADVVADSSPPTLTYSDSHTQNIKRYIDEREAVEWLQGCRRREATAPQEQGS
jgi:hypothetical protein